MEYCIAMQDQEVIAEVTRIPAKERTQYLVEALRIGVLALRTARGEVDARAIKERLDAALTQVRSMLQEFAGVQLVGLLSSLKAELASSHITMQGSAELAQSKVQGMLDKYSQTVNQELTRATGKGTPLYEALDPKVSTGLNAAVRQELNATVERIKTEVRTQFSRDSAGSAMKRLETLLAESTAKITAQFTLDSPTSALYRLSAQISGQVLQITAQMDKFQVEVRERLAA